MRRWCASLCLCLMMTVPGLAQTDDDDDDLRPGLLARVTLDATAADALTQIVPEPVLVAAPNASAAHPTRVNWTGRFLSRGEGPHQFHAYVAGSVTVRLGEQTVLSAESMAAGWVSGPRVELQFGEFPLEISASLSAPGQAAKLYWSADNFPLEPLPYHALFHDDDTTAIRQMRQGRDLVEAWQCRSCHSASHAAKPPAESLLPGPSLQHVGQGTAAGWLQERLKRAEPIAHSRMPAFGFSNDDAQAILAYLKQQSQRLKLADWNPKSTEKEVAAGQQLVKSVGCLACHSLGELGRQPLLGGGALDAVARQRSPAWIEAKLRDPHHVNSASRMPTFTLTDAERRQIVLALTSASAAVTPLTALPTTAAQIERGRALVKAARCAACHELPAEVREFPLATPLLESAAVSARGCLVEPVESKTRRPRFPGDSAAAVAAYLNVAQIEQTQRTPDVQGQRLLETKGCVQCHDRNGSRGLSALTQAIIASESTWNGQAPTLQPPSLTAVGDRLPDAVLNKAISGNLPQRMDWLRVRMPKFRHTPAEAALLAEHLIAHDRIPDNAPATIAYPVSPTNVDPQVMLAGRELTGGKGFSCVACHQLKDYVPPKVALGTRGSDLYRLGERMREPYFFRWTRAPLRVLPGVEMPSYLRPHPTILGGDIQRQLAAIWDALHDPQFTAPTNIAVVEQLWGPSESGAPRILRDVVTLPDGAGKTESVPRAFAVGFGNRHSVLFDLDRGALRVWTIGDFARQRTQGKSWFWDMAGVPVAADFHSAADVYLIAAKTQQIVSNATGWQPKVRLRESQVEAPRSVLWQYDITWSHADHPALPPVSIVERWTAEDLGWRRQVRVDQQPDGYDVYFRQPQFQRAFGDPAVTVDGELWQAPVKSAPPGRRLPSPATTDFPLTLHYHTELIAPAIELNPALPENWQPEPVTCIPGFDGERLPLSRAIMPTALAWDDRGRLVFTSLKGHVYRATASSASRGLPDRLTTVAEGLAAPYGIIAVDDKLLISHKPEVLLLDDMADDATPARRQRVVATGWGFTDDYHDWACGIVRDSVGMFYVALGSDYSHRNRPTTESLWRGQVLRFDLAGNIEPIADGLRYATGLAMLPGDRLFCSDQQGVQNCFNELNFVQAGKRYGVPAQRDAPNDGTEQPAAIQIPHPWTRSVNGVAVWPDNGHPFAGQIVGAEYNERFLLRASVDEVDGVLQGAVYPLHRKGETNGPEELLGPLSVAFSPEGHLYVGSIHDSGWMGGLNTGDIVRFVANKHLPNGIREVRVTPQGFAIEFLRPIDAARAADPQRYQLSGYTRVWQGSYATPDSGRHVPTITGVTTSDDARTVFLSLTGLKTGHVYDIAVGDIGRSVALWPTTAYYTLHRIPAAPQ